MPYRIAILHDQVQISDIASIDLFGNLSRAIMDWAATSFPVPPHIDSQAVNIEFLWVAGSLEPAGATPNIKIVPTHTYETCPRDVDVVLVGGPLMSHRPEKSLELFRDIFSNGKDEGRGKGKDGVVLLTTCTGSMWVAASGVLDGKKCTTNRMALEMAGEVYPGVLWEDRRWVVDAVDLGEGGKGKIWTSGGAGCGIDMIATFIEQHFPHPISTFARLGLDYDPHVLGQEYAAPLSETLAKLAPKA